MFHPPKHHPIGTKGALILGDHGSPRQSVIFGTIAQVTFTETATDVSVEYVLTTSHGSRVTIANKDDFFKLDGYSYERSEFADALIARAAPEPEPVPVPEPAPAPTPAPVPESTGSDEEWPPF